MSTKINVRSPFYISIASPTAPTPVFDKTYANPQDFSVDVNGNLSLPRLDYGVIEDVTSTDPDFSNDKFPEEASETNRTVRLFVRVPDGFSNAGEIVDFEVSAIQPASIAACAAVLSPTASTVTFSLNTGGNSSSVDMSTHFTGTGTKDEYIVTNLHPAYFEATIGSNGVLTITSKSQAGTFSATVTVYDNDEGCSASKTVTVTLTSLATFTDSDADIRGGEIQADGTIIDPSVIGTITARRTTPTGSPITSHTANDTGSNRDVTLYFDVTVPSGFANSGQTVQVSKVFSQPPQSVTPVFDVNLVDVDDEAILQNGLVVGGTAEYRHEGTTYNVEIQSFTPTSFPTVSSRTNRTVTYTFVIPNGFQNAGTTVTRDITIRQPALEVDLGANPCALHTTTVYYGILSVAGYDVFQFQSTGAAHWYRTRVGAIEVSNLSQLEGRTICVGGNVLTPPSGNLTSIGFTSGAGQTTAAYPIEYFIQFGSNGIIEHLWRKDWNTRTKTRIF